MSRSDEDTIKQNGKNYQIDLTAFSASRVRLETELRNSQTPIHFIQTINLIYHATYQATLDTLTNIVDVNGVIKQYHTKEPEITTGKETGHL